MVTDANGIAARRAGATLGTAVPAALRPPTEPGSRQLRLHTGTEYSADAESNPAAGSVVTSTLVTGQPTGFTVTEEFAREAMVAGVRAAAAKTGDRNLAQDLTQNALMRMLHRSERLGFITSPMAYFHKVLSTEIADHYRTRELERPIGDFQSLELLLPSVGDGAEELVAGDRIEEVLEMIARISGENAMELVKMRFVDDLTFHQIAEKLGYTAVTVAARLRRIRGQLSLREQWVSDLAPVDRQRPAADIRVRAGTPSRTSVPLTDPAAEQIRLYDERQRELLDRQIAKLSGRQRAVIDLARIGTTPAQCAAQLGITPNNARVTLYTARKLLRERMNIPADRLDHLLRRPLKNAA
ncbi:RNA polymerase sigma factor [Kitasatospora phosalacinea]|uniref:RNA polymerase sigma factor 70 region 4 type 2 domain-containing protein n=1 Tax=Kitasatospora phosalacinea TaxID=2065 RepID=A0A9W6PNJ8_9ACTN|nr:sigma-70 family RNA polymerase sigma factor [Kitasatospora phosalacinea]GLW58129.1 hypothetical protein Kpho01_61400 [Kitasatospora phosalacinea]